MALESPAGHVATPQALRAIFERQKQGLVALRQTSARERKAKLKRISAYLLDEGNEAKLNAAMWLDLRKSPMEVAATEVGPLLLSIKHICRNLGHWMAGYSVPVPLSLIGLRAETLPQPKGNCLLISPWNYPLQLALNPLLYAIAAGNAVMLKPSEISSHTTEFISGMLSELFPASEVAVVKGDASVSTALLELPFNHIFFTGSPQVGKIVMAAASRHLASVTLELGGKSPVVVDASVNLKKVAEQVAWAKCINNGQTCIAPDYVLLAGASVEEFVQHFRQAVDRFYNPQGKGIAASPDYGRIVNARHFRRLQGLLEDAVSKGATQAYSSAMDAEALFMEPIVLTGLDESMEVMQEEIFGPILPVIAVKDMAEAAEVIARRPPALAFYVMSRSKRNVRFLQTHSSSGGMVVNDLMLSSVNPHLPFGGVNHSGIGKSNGRYGFEAFSNLRGVTHRSFGNLRFVFPPFTEGGKRFLQFISKYF